MPSETAIVRPKKLDSWKEIADYLGRDVRTAMRWEQELGLPIRRVPGGKRRAVFALTDEIDAWLLNRTTEIAPQLSPRFAMRDRYQLWLVSAVALVSLLATFFLATRFGRMKSDEFVFELPSRKLYFVLQTIRSGKSFGQIRAVDVNGDGFPDIVVGGGAAGRLAVFLNHDGGFDQAQYLDSCSNSQGPSVADYDGDGKLDIAIACAETGELEIWWGTGGENFSSPKRWKVGEAPITTDAGDLDADGLADIAVGSTGGGPLVVLFGDRGRELRRREFVIPQPNSPILADIDGDGKLDIVTGSVLLSANQFTYLRGRGDGRFDKPRFIPAGCLAWRIAVADFSGKGSVDIVGASAAGELTLVRGLGAGRFGPPSVLLRGPTSQLVWTISERGKNSVLNLQFFPAVVRIIDFDRDGVASLSSAVLLPNSPMYATSADFNRDGLTDLAFVSHEGVSAEVDVLLQRSK